MSYEVTATRRRPQQFENLVGQEFVSATLSNSIKSGKIAHAYLFSGPRGCGKTSTARILAKALNCQNGPTATPCGECSNCKEITKGSSLDVIEIDGASNTSVENIRRIKDEVLFPPSNSKYKIYIIDEVHMLSISAFNALLKTIEEPPAHVIFIFATTELQKVPATIKSRCQQFNFRLVSIDKVKQCLAEAAAELGIQADDEALFWIARESTGSMRDAYTLFDQVVAFSDNHITYEKIRDKLGLVGIERLNSIFEACVSKNTVQVTDLLDEFIQNGVPVEQLVSNSADYLRSLLLIKSGVQKESLLGNKVERFSSNVLNAWNTVQIERGLSIFLNLYRDIRYSLSQRYELELAFSRICFLSEYVSASEVKKAIDAAQALLLKGAEAGTGAVTQITGNVQPASTSPAINTNSGGGASINSSAGSASQSNTFTSDGNQIHIPNGLPRLSMLNKQETPEEEDSQGENSSPFYNGGSLPPEQSANDSNVQSIQEWSNMDAPPDDDYSGDYDGYESYDSSEEDWSESQPEEPQYIPEEQEEKTAPVQLQDIFTTADGTRLSIAQLRGNVMAALSVNDSFAASALEKTREWKITNDSLETSVENSYDFELVNKKLSVITEEVSKICGQPIKINIKIEDKKNLENIGHTELPVPVKILVNAFKGTVIAGKM
ncbi:MAG: DNA polymerase III subunit gamma/tau [Spirochaetales bacterium]|nr:DNA polymerase III subunit gamma/tau [Spirochaetales bacterium]